MESSDLMIRLTGVGMQWERNTALRDVNLEIHRGDFLAITGPNGGGKTTLLRIILKLQKPSHGSVTYWRNGSPTASLPIGYLPQKNAIDSRFPLTLAQVIASGVAGWGLTSRKRRAMVSEIIDLVGLKGKRDSPIGELSGGQLQRTLLGRALISRPELLVLDEPLSYLDQHFAHRICDIIGSLRPHTTILLVSHEMSELGRLATRHLIVDTSIHPCGAEHHITSSECR